MKRIVFCAVLLAAITLLGVSYDVRAASLYGKVIEVNDGDIITVYNLNRPVRVRLLGIDAPEINQPFAEVAKQHLADLTLNKMVTVEYSSLGTHSLIVGKVTIDGFDICAQMIRDGAAWFDINNNSRLSDTDRLVYTQSEVAARTEKRGLWQSESIAPWEWTKMQAAKMAPPSYAGSLPKRTTSTSTSELTTMGLFRSAASASTPSNDNNDWAKPGPREWRKYEPAGGKFSVILPSQGREGTETVMFRDTPIDFRSYLVSDGFSVYAVSWAVGPYLGETDQVASLQALAGVIKGIGTGFEERGSKFDCPATPKMIDVSKDGFFGQQFDLTKCTLPGYGRVYTRVEGEQRRLIVGFAFAADKQIDPAKRFIQSFSLER